MLDSLKPDSLNPQDSGLCATLGQLAFQLECSHRDGEKLLAEKDPVVFTVLEIEGERLSRPVLLGFASKNRRDLYHVLRGLKGIGRRSALAVLDTGDTLDILRAVAAQDPSLFQAIPGLGAKRLQALFETLGSAYEGALPKPLPIPVALWVEVRESLVSAGLSNSDAEKRLATSSLQGDAEAIYKEIINTNEP